MKIKPVDYMAYIEERDEVDSLEKLRALIKKHGILSFNKYEVLDIVGKVESRK